MQLQHLCSPHSHTFVRYVLALHKPQYLLLFYLVYFLCLELKHGVLMQLDTCAKEIQNDNQNVYVSVGVQGAGHDCK